MSQTTLTKAHHACSFIQELMPNFKPLVGVVLGSGLGSFAETLQDAKQIPYSEIPGFPTLNVHGHGGNLCLGYLHNIPIVCLQGRAHLYEGTNVEFVKTYVRTLKLLGAKYFIATNAAGSMQASIGPGKLMLITDHINLQPTNPLIGPNDECFGPRFVPLDNVYDKKLQAQLLQCAKELKLPLHQGVYLAVSGPCYETAAEIRAFRILGADVVGMSTVPEVLVAAHCGLKVAVISMITNLATGLATEAHSHDNVVATAQTAANSLNLLLNNFISQLQ